MLVSEIKQVIEGLKDTDQVYCIYDDYDELHYTLHTEEDIIDKANNQAGIGDFKEEGVEPISDIDTAIQYLIETDDTIHIME